MPKTIRHRRRPPVRIILGERVCLQPLLDQAIAAGAALNRRTFEQQAVFVLRQHLGF